MRAVSLDPLVVRGAHFAPGERVSVKLYGLLRATRTARADGTGVFRVVFSPIRYGRCAVSQVRATGSRGSKAMLRFPQLACMPS
jgi:hypothetical protein